MYLAEVPKTFMRSLRSAKIEERAGTVRMERRAVVEQQRRPEARPDTSQFHIIQPHVVK